MSGRRAHVVAAPAGVPRGYDALRAGATSEHLGGGLRIEIASIADLITMAAALRRPEDVERLPALRQILRLEADRAALVTTSALPPGSALDLRRPRDVRPNRGQDPGVGR
jgi:hypothetical protein